MWLLLNPQNNGPENHILDKTSVEYQLLLAEESIHCHNPERQNTSEIQEIIYTIIIWIDKTHVEHQIPVVGQSTYSHYLKKTKIQCEY